MRDPFKSLILLSVFCAPCFGTTFIPTSVAERINYSDGIVGGNYLGKSVKKLPSGQVVTEHSFKVSKIAGISPSSIVNKNNFKILVPGGAWNGSVHKISGTPTFKRGEEVVLMISEGPFGYIMPDLSFSKFNYQSIDGKKFLVSPIFSNKPGVGKISLDDFQKISEDHFGSKLAHFNIDKFIDKPSFVPTIKKGRRVNPRAPASEKTEEKESNSPFIWAVFALGILGFFSTTLYKGGKEK